MKFKFYCYAWSNVSYRREEEIEIVPENQDKVNTILRERGEL